jgi:hypothetical protein
MASEIFSVASDFGIGIGHSHQVAEPELHSAPPSLVFILQHVNYHINSEFTEFIIHVTAWHQEFFSVASASAMATRLPSPAPSCTRHHPH